MTLSCNVNINLNNLNGSVETQINSVLELQLGTPAGLQAIADQIGDTFNDIGGAIVDAVESIPIPDISLREELAALALLPAAGIAAAAKLAQIVGDFADATGLEGFVDLDLTDLSKSVFSLSTSFDPCNPSIPNIFKSPDGTLKSKPSSQPNLGDTKAAEDNKKTQTITNNRSEALRSNTNITSFLSISSASSAITGNISTSITGMGNTIRKTSTGEQVVEDKPSFISRIKTNRLSLLTEV